MFETSETQNISGKMIYADETADDSFLNYLESRIDETAAPLRSEAEFDPRKAAMRYFSDLCYKTGSTYIPEDELFSNRMLERYGLSYFDIEDVFLQLAEDDSLALSDIYGQRRYYIKHMLNCEENIAARLSAIKKYEKKPLPFKEYMRAFAACNHIVLSEGQQNAVESVFNNKITVITGGPGTGKTRVIETVCHILMKNKASFKLCAFTGKAVTRLTELTGCSACTIHRLLRFRTDDDINKVENTAEYVGLDESEPVKADYIIIDEMSMVDADLFSALLSAVSDKSNIVLVGDEYQLPSIRPGAVLRDIIASKRFECIKLTEVFRQEHDSGLAEIYTALKNKFPLKNNADFRLIECNNEKSAVNTACELFADKNSYEKVQLLSAYKSKKRPSGTDNINTDLKALCNSGSFTVKINGRDFSVNDRIIITANDYNAEYLKNGSSGYGIFNGETGYISDIDDSKKTIAVVFDDGKKAVLSYDKTSDMSLAYGVTIHKSQGSEYENVIVVIGVYTDFITWNMLFTALSRAKKSLILVCVKDTVKKIYNNKTVRYSGLKDIIEDEVI